MRYISLHLLEQTFRNGFNLFYCNSNASLQASIRRILVPDFTFFIATAKHWHQQKCVFWYQAGQTILHCTSYTTLLKMYARRRKHMDDCMRPVGRALKTATLNKQDGPCAAPLVIYILPNTRCNGRELDSHGGCSIQYSGTLCCSKCIIKWVSHRRAVRKDIGLHMRTASFRRRTLLKHKCPRS